MFSPGPIVAWCLPAEAAAGTAVQLDSQQQIVVKTWWGEERSGQRMWLPSLWEKWGTLFHQDLLKTWRDSVWNSIVDASYDWAFITYPVFFLLDHYFTKEGAIKEFLSVCVCGWHQLRYERENAGRERRERTVRENGERERKERMERKMKNRQIWSVLAYCLWSGIRETGRGWERTWEGYLWDYVSDDACSTHREMDGIRGGLAQTWIRGSVGGIVSEWGVLGSRSRTNLSCLMLQERKLWELHRGSSWNHSWHEELGQPVEEQIRSVT